jgi:hypothetical protein
LENPFIGSAKPRDYDTVPESHTSECRSHKFGRVAHAAQQAASTMQSLDKSGAQALLTSVWQGALANAQKVAALDPRRLKMFLKIKNLSS